MRYVDLCRHHDATTVFEYRLAIAETETDKAQLHDHARDMEWIPLVALLMRMTLCHPNGDFLLSRPALDGWGMRSVATSTYEAMVMDRAFLQGESLHPWHMAYSQRALDWLHWNDALQDIQRRIRELYPQYLRQYHATLKNHKLYKAMANGTIDRDRARAVGAPIFSEFREEREILRQDQMPISASLLQAQERLDAMSSLSIDDDLSTYTDGTPLAMGKDEDSDEDAPDMLTVWARWLLVCAAITIVSLCLVALGFRAGMSLAIVGTFWVVVCLKMRQNSNRTAGRIYRYPYGVKEN